jgi:recombination DNA repair RAD52 pathway protein
MAKELSVRKIPSLSDLYADKVAMVKQNELNLILNAEPKVKVHPIAKQKYLPIERVEYLLTVIFGSWNVEIRDTKLIANSVVVTVRVHVKDPITGEPMFQDGLGAMPIQIDKSSTSAIDFQAMKANAIQLGAPAAESYAIKDAAEKFGKIFGKDVNRKDSVDYVDRIYSMVASMGESNLGKDLLEQIERCANEEQLTELYEKNKGLGKYFDNAIIKHRDFIRAVAEQENNQPDIV